MEEVVNTALYMTAAAVVAGLFLVLRLANAAADIHAEGLADITRIERERDDALKASQSKPYAQQLFPVYSFSGDPNIYRSPDNEPDEIADWKDIAESKDVEIDWNHVPDDVEVYAQVIADVSKHSQHHKPNSKQDGGGIVRVWNLTDSTVAITGGKYPINEEQYHKISLRIPRCSSVKEYRLQLQVYSLNAMVSVTGDAVLRGRRDKWDDHQRNTRHSASSLIVF